LVSNSKATYIHHHVSQNLMCPEIAIQGTNSIIKHQVTQNMAMVFTEATTNKQIEGN
jgi:hypothetical protein